MKKKLHIGILLLYFSIYINAGIGEGVSSAGTVLPVELTSFTASFTNSSVNLAWSTATEVNNYGFEVERKRETEDWKEIGFVAGHGNSNSPKEYFFDDKSLIAGKYNYRLKQIDIDGTFEYSAMLELDLGIPENFSLSQNYPNPFNPTTVITYSIPEISNVTLKVYDVLGKLITTLVDQNQEGGTYQITFDSASESQQISNGIYFYRIEAENFVITKKMLLLK